MVVHIETKSNWSKLYELLRDRAYSEKVVTLSSGKQSNYYFDCKSVTLLPEGAFLTAKEMLDRIEHDIGLKNVNAIGGLEIGATPLAGALAFECYLRGCTKINFFIVRKQAKGHGERKLVEGPEISSGSNVVLIDDVVTTGGSVMKAVEAMRELKCKIAQVVVLVDRKEGAEELLAKENILMSPLFTIDDFRS